MKYLISALAIGLILCSASIRAQEVNVNPYVGISGDFILLEGSFDGESYFTTEEEIILVPKLDPSFGFGALVGFKIGNGALDFAYHYSRMEYTSLEDGFSGKNTTHLIRYLGFKKYFKSFAEKKFQPYVDFDLSIAFLRFEKISYLINSPSEVRSANYGGVIFGAGIGSQMELSKSLYIDLKILPELYIGSSIRSKDSERYEIKKFNNFLLISSIGLNYYFKSK